MSKDGRRTSARVKSRKVSPPPPAKRKRPAASSSKKMAPLVDGSTTTTASTSAVVAVGGGGDSAVIPVVRSDYAKVTDTLRKFNKYYLNFIQVVDCVVYELIVSSVNSYVAVNFFGCSGICRPKRVGVPSKKPTSRQKNRHRNQKQNQWLQNAYSPLISASGFSRSYFGLLAVRLHCTS